MAVVQASWFARRLSDMGGETGRLMVSRDWSTSPLGAPEHWPQSLRSVVGLMLGSKFPMFVAWGGELGFLYNDAYAEILGSKHPQALGARFGDVWSEIWPDISPLIGAALAGDASYREDLPLVVNRRGYDEPAWFTFSYSPVHDESGQVAGMFCAVAETTGKVLAERERAQRLELEERLRRATLAAGMFSWESDYLADTIVWGPGAADILGVEPGELPSARADGQFFVADGEHERLAREFDAAAAERSPNYVAEFRGRDGREWRAESAVTYSVDGAPLKVFGLTRDITAERVATRRDTYLLRLATALGPLRDAARIQSTAAELLGRELDAGRVCYAEVDEAAGVLTVRSTFVQRGMPGGGGGVIAFADVPGSIAALRRGEPLIVSDMRLDQRTALQADNAAVQATAGRALLDIPLLKDGALVAVLSVNDPQPREWTDAEVRLARETAERTWAAVERTRAEIALRESEAALAAEVEALGRLQEVSTRLVGDDSPQAIYDAILTAATDLMGSECASIQMLDEAGDLKLLAHRGYDARSAAYWATVGARSGSTYGVALTTRERVVVADVEDSGFGADGPDLKSYRWSGIRAVQTTPLLSRAGRAVGMISTHWKRPHTPSQRDFKLFDVLARQAADAIERTMAKAELHKSEARQAFLLSFADTLRSLRTPEEIASAAAERLGERFGLSRVFYAELHGATMKVDSDYARGVDSIVGEHDLSAFGPEILTAYREQPVVKVDDVRTDPRFSEDGRAGLLERQVGAYLDVTLFQDDRRVSLLALQSATPRVWTASEEGLFREIGERVKAAIERARAEDRLRELNETLERRVAETAADLNRVWRNASDMFVVVDRDGAFRRVNPATEAILGWPESHMLGRTLFDFVHPDDVERTVGALERARGDVLPTFENRYRAKDGGLRTIAWVAAPEGDLIYAYGRDVTADRVRQAELAVAQDALRQSQKMEAIGQLTGGVAHDFNNLLAPIVGSLDLLERKGLGGEREQRLIAAALQSADRAKTLVQRLLAFARRQPLQPIPVDVAKLVTGMADLVASTTGPQIKVLVEAPDDLPPAKADPNQLEMALLNLAVNARDAMADGGGMLRISTRAEDIGKGHRTKLRPGRYLCLSVADTGAGMDEATVARAVEPFFSTKGVGKGTGLGLSMAHGLASQLGGALTLQSWPGLGTNVELWLPCSDVEPETGGRASAPAEASTARGTALLVDDEELVRMSTADMLSDLGYAVIEAASGEEALRLLGEGERFDLLVTDHLMPGISGTDLAREVRAAKPAVQVLLVSGYAESEGLDPDLPRLTKPFRKNDLAATLAQLAFSG